MKTVSSNKYWNNSQLYITLPAPTPPQKRVFTLHNKCHFQLSIHMWETCISGIPREKTLTGEINNFIQKKLWQLQAQKKKVYFQQKAQVNANMRLVILKIMRFRFYKVIELSGVKFGLKSQVWFQTKIARHEVQLPLYCIRFKIAQILDLKFNSSTFFLLGGGGNEFWKQKLQTLPHDTLCFSFSCNLIGYFKQALKCDWLFCF